MSAESTVPGATPGIPSQAGAPSTTVLPNDRRDLGLDAAWELDALRETVRDLCDNLGDPDLTQGDLMALRLKVRGLTVRMGQLASVVMSVLDDDDETASLFKKVHGHAPATEVAHG